MRGDEHPDPGPDVAGRRSRSSAQHREHVGWDRPHDTSGEVADKPGAQGEEPPPILGSWVRLYAIVLVHLLILIALFTWFTKGFE